MKFRAHFRIDPREKSVCTVVRGLANTMSEICAQNSTLPSLNRIKKYIENVFVDINPLYKIGGKYAGYLRARFQRPKMEKCKLSFAQLLVKAA